MVSSSLFSRIIQYTLIQLAASIQYGSVFFFLYNFNKQSCIFIEKNPFRVDRIVHWSYFIFICMDLVGITRRRSRTQFGCISLREHNCPIASLTASHVFTLSLLMIFLGLLISSRVMNIVSWVLKKVHSKR